MSINIVQLETFFCNTYFLISFLITIYYWIKAIFFSKRTYFSYGFFGFVFINILLVLQLSLRWYISGHFPLSSLYESLLFLAWALITIYLGIENFIKTEIIGVILAPIILCLLTFSGFSLPNELQSIKPLVPALQSNWLFMHVSVMMLSYAGLLIGSILSITYLVIFNFTKKTSLLTQFPVINYAKFNPVQISNENDRNYNQVVGSTQDLVPNELNKQKIFNNLLMIFDNLSYRTIGIGFCFLTLGILSGAVWANETWGTYWSWDPKETWALITWLIFAAYLHTRLLYGWNGVKSAQIASFGFLLIWICYLGVNLLGKGLHSYGFFT